MRRKPDEDDSDSSADEKVVVVLDAALLSRRIGEVGVMREFAEEEADIIRAIAGRSMSGSELVGALIEPTRRLCNRDGQPCSTGVLRSVMLSVIAIVACDSPVVLRAAIDDMALIRPHSPG